MYGSAVSHSSYLTTVAVRPDLPQPTHWLEEEDTLRSILFLGLKACHLRLKNRLLNGSHHTLL
jgi:hypothetical protein